MSPPNRKTLYIAFLFKGFEQVSRRSLADIAGTEASSQGFCATEPNTGLLVSQTDSDGVCP